MLLNTPKLDKVTLAMLEELAKKTKKKPETYLTQLISQMYNHM